MDVSRRQPFQKEKKVPGKLISLKYYFFNQDSDIVDAEYVNQLFGTKECLLSNLDSLAHNEIPVRMTKHGEIMGSDTFLKEALKKFNRRQQPTEQSIGVRREDDRYFAPIDLPVGD